MPEESLGGTCPSALTRWPHLLHRRRPCRRPCGHLHRLLLRLQRTLNLRRETVRQQAHRPPHRPADEPPDQRPRRLYARVKPVRGQLLAAWRTPRTRRSGHQIPRPLANIVLVGQVGCKTHLHGRTDHGPAGCIGAGHCVSYRTTGPWYHPAPLRTVPGARTAPCSRRLRTRIDGSCSIRDRCLASTTAGRIRLPPPGPTSPPWQASLIPQRPARIAALQLISRHSNAKIMCEKPPTSCRNK